MSGNEDAAAGGTGAGAATGEIAAIERRMAIDRAGYFADKDQQARYRALVVARDSGAAGDAQAAGPAERPPMAVAPGPGAAEAGHAPALSPALDAVAQAWRKAGDFDRRADRGSSLLAAMNAHLGAEEGRAFLTSVDGLPGAVQAAFAEEAARPPWGGHAAPVDAAVVKAFADSPAFAGLVRAWHGADSATTARKVAILNARLDRAMERMKPAERATALAWWERLPGRDAAALAWHLTGGTK